MRAAALCEEMFAAEEAAAAEAVYFESRAAELQLEMRAEEMRADMDAEEARRCGALGWG